MWLMMLVTFVDVLLMTWCCVLLMMMMCVVDVVDDGM